MLDQQPRDRPDLKPDDIPEDAASAGAAKLRLLTDAIILTEDYASAAVELFSGLRKHGWVISPPCAPPRS